MDDSAPHNRNRMEHKTKGWAEAPVCVLSSANVFFVIPVEC